MSDSQTTTIPTPPFPDTLDEGTAQQYTLNWLNYMDPGGKNPDFIRAFYIPAVDIEDLAALAIQYGCDGVRAYIGLTNAEDPSTAKLILVPAIGSSPGQDMLKLPDSPVVYSTIFDFTSPCPQSCDNSSPLMNNTTV